MDGEETQPGPNDRIAQLEAELERLDREKIFYGRTQLVFTALLLAACLFTYQTSTGIGVIRAELQQMLETHKSQDEVRKQLRERITALMRVAASQAEDKKISPKHP